MFHLLLLLWSSSLSDHLPPLQCRDSFTSFFPHFMIISIEICFLHGLFLLSFVPSVQFMQIFSFCKVYTNTNLPIKLCNFYKFLIWRFYPWYFHLFDIEAPSLPFNISLTSLSFCFVKVSFTEQWVKSKSHKTQLCINQLRKMFWIEAPMNLTLISYKSNSSGFCNSVFHDFKWQSSARTNEK